MSSCCMAHTRVLSKKLHKEFSKFTGNYGVECQDESENTTNVGWRCK